MNTPTQPGRRYRSRPVEIRAMTRDEAVAHYQANGDEHMRTHVDESLWVRTIGGAWVLVRADEYVIREPDGKGYYPCHPDVFARRWEAIE